jgi:hypothetical protein
MNFSGVVSRRVSSFLAAGLSSWRLGGIPVQPLWIYGEKNGVGRGFVSEYFGLSLSESVRQCSFLIHSSIIEAYLSK